MSILPSSNVRRYENVAELVDVSVSMPLFTDDVLTVYYGEIGLTAVLNVDYDIILNEVDYSNFIFRPFESLILKIEALIVIEPTERNTVLLVRTLPLSTTATPASSRNSEFVSKEFDRITMKLQQLEEVLSRALGLSIFTEDDVDLVVPRVPGSVLVWNDAADALLALDIELDTIVGPGVPAGGTVGQLLTKLSSTDYDSDWLDPPISVPYVFATAAGSATLEFAEDTDNGVHKLTVRGAASQSSDKTQTFLDVTGTILAIAATELPVVDNTIPRFDSTTGLIQKSTATISDGGNLKVFGDIKASADGSTTASPRVMGFEDFSPAEAVSVQFGDNLNSWQGGFGLKMQWNSYYGIVVSGSRLGAAMAFEVDSGPLGFEIRAAAANRVPGGVSAFVGQTADLFQFLDSGAALLAAVTKDGYYKVGANQVISTRKTGWGAPTGTATRTTFVTSTVTLPQLAERLKALIDDLTLHGLIGA